MKFKWHLSSYVLSLLLLQGCGGGGGGSPTSSGPTYGGLTSEANIDAANSRDLSTAAASGALQAVISDGVSNISFRSPPSLEAKLVKISPRIAQWLASQGGAYGAKVVNVSYLCDAGGSAVADSDNAETRGTITLTNCSISDGIGNVSVLNGTVDFTRPAADFINLVYHVTVSYMGTSTPLNMSVSCTDIGCTIASDFIGLDSRIYRIGEFSVAGSADFGFYVSATVYDPDHGSFSLDTTSGIGFDCPSPGVPSTGLVSITGAGDISAAITFDNCDSFSVTIGGVVETFDW